MKKQEEVDEVVSQVVSDLIHKDNVIQTFQGEELTIPRLPMRGVFKLMALMKEGIGDVFDVLQGSAPEFDPESGEAVQAGRTADVIRSIAGVLIQREDTIYDLIATVCKKTSKQASTEAKVEVSRDWVADNLVMEDVLAVFAVVIRQEITPRFFDRLREVQAAYNQARVSQETPSNGSGPQSATLLRSLDNPQSTS